MDKIVNLESLFHRSKERIKDLGEVFTPDKYVEDMLDLLSKGKRNFWSSEDNVFFEPCCGHGNIVLAVYKRRLDAIYKANFKEYSKEASFYAVANTLNTLWAIDIDKQNVESCRARIVVETVNFMKKKLSYNSYIELLEDNQDFFAHVLSAIRWHIYENETITSLVNNKKVNIPLTAHAEEWIRINEAQSLEFEKTWCDFYQECEESQMTSLIYEKAYKYIEQILLNKTVMSKDFSFALLLKEIISSEKYDEYMMEA